MSDFLRDFPPTEDDTPFRNDDEARAFIRAYVGRSVVQGEKKPEEPPREITFVDEDGNDFFAKIARKDSSEQSEAE